MSYINRYTKPDSNNDYFSNEFLGDGRPFVLSVGTTNNKGLVTKIDSNGDLEWERTYEIQGASDPVIFRKVIQLTPKNAGDRYLYIIHATAKYDNHIIAIESDDGDVHWSFRLDWSDNLETIDIDQSLNNYAIFGAFTDVNYKTIAFRIDGDNGQLEESNFLTTDEGNIKIKALKSYDAGFTITGFTESNPKGVIVEFDENVKLSNSLFITGTGNHKYYEIPDTKDKLSRIELNRTGFFFLNYHNPHGILYNIDWNFNIEWTKEIRFSGLPKQKTIPLI